MYNRFTTTLAAVLITGLLAGCGPQEESPTTTTPTAPPESGSAPESAIEQVAEQAEETAKTVTKVVETAKDELDQLLASFQNADAGTLANLQKAVAAVREADYSQALPLLQQVAGNVNLTPEQKQLLQPIIDMVTQKLGKAAVNQAVEEPAEAVSDLKKSLPLGQ
jgi:hypothetical protein